MSIGRFTLFLWALCLIFILLGITTTDHPSNSVIKLLAFLFGAGAMIYMTEWAKEHYSENTNTNDRHENDNRL